MNCWMFALMFLAQSSGTTRQHRMRNCQPGWMYFLFHCYKIGWSRTALTMDEAQNQCENDYANLASICTDVENDFIRVHMGPPENIGSSDAWIGLKASKNTLRYYIDSNACPYRRWYSGMDPENRAKPEYNGKNCTILDSEGEWDIEDCDNKDLIKAYVCKKRAGYP